MTEAPTGNQPHGPRDPLDAHRARAAAVPARSPDEPVPFDERLLHWLRRATVVGVVASILLHLVVWFIAAHTRIDRPGEGSAAAMPETVDFAVMTETELAELQQASLAYESPSVPELEREPLPEIEALDRPTEAEITGALSDLVPADLGVGAGDVSQTAGIGEGGSGSGSASFFGVEATGSRFVYIVDVSGSMAVGGKMEALQRELVKSVEGLLQAADFQIITYSDGASPLEGRGSWLDADERGKRFARRAIAKLASGGSTNPGPAFELAFDMRPLPEAIYFMTDGEFHEEVAGQIAMLNSEYRVPVHCIAFVSRGSEPLMRRIASQSGGTYTFVPAPMGAP